MSWQRVYLALGSNLGDRAANLHAACRALSPQVQIERASPIYETDPWGYADQPPFYNQVLRARTELEPLALLNFLKQTETRLGRQPSVRYGPRLIDLDILFYNDQVLQTDALTLPHPRLHERSFVLIPLKDLAADLRHPVLGQTVRELCAALDCSSVRRSGLPTPPLPWGTRTFIMGILNVTPDSFSGDGLLSRQDVIAAALEQAWQFAAAGADILDIGGESTRPGAQPVSAEQEAARVLPVIEALRRAGPDVLLSVDTCKASVANAALQAGAHWVNDVWGLRADPDLAVLVAAANVPIVLMHNRSQPANTELQARLGGRYVGIEYANLIEDVRNELLQSVALAHAAGIPDTHIILDPGIGFGKTVAQNLELMRRLDEIRALGYPLLLGPSRKSFIGYTLNLPPEQRLEGTLAACVLGIERGADILRVHDVSAVARAARLTDAILH